MGLDVRETTSGRRLAFGRGGFIINVFIIDASENSNTGTIEADVVIIGEGGRGDIPRGRIKTRARIPTEE